MLEQSAKNTARHSSVTPRGWHPSRTSTTMLAAACLLASGGAWAKTGQGVFVDLNVTGSRIINQTQSWDFNSGSATGLFSNTVGTLATTTCTRTNNNGTVSNCPNLNNPPSHTPLPPDPDKTVLTAGNNQCSLFNGTNLSGHTYQQSRVVIVPTGNNKGTWTFTYNYHVSPLNAFYPERTAWNLGATTGPTSTEVQIAATIAGQSLLIMKDGVSVKYSFSLLDSAGNSRVSNLLLQIWDVTDPNAPVVVGSASPSHTILPGDFNYAASNAGTFGTSASLLKTGSAMVILNTDGHAGNDGGGSNGSALARALTEAVPAQLPPGDYRFQLTGTVKGNSADATSSQPFNVQVNTTVLPTGC